MKESKFDRFMGKVMVFCWKHRFAIGLGTSMLGAYCYGAHKQSEVYKAQEKAAKDEKEMDRITKEAIEEFNAAVKEYDEKMKAYREDPANHLSCGGVIMNDAWYEGYDAANLIFNDVPMEKLGEFGEAVKERMISHPGAMEPEDLSDILGHNPHCDIVLSIYPGNTEEQEEPESQQKQGC